MKCDLKTMLKIGAVLAAILGIGFFVFPQFRPVILGLAPFAFFALCPISMFFAMRTMNKDQHNHDSCASCAHEHKIKPIKNNQT